MFQMDENPRVELNRVRKNVEEKNIFCTPKKIAAFVNDAIKDYFGEYDLLSLLGEDEINLSTGLAFLKYLSSDKYDIADIAMHCSDYKFEQIKEKVYNVCQYNRKKQEQRAIGLEVLSEFVGEKLVELEKLRHKIDLNFDKILLALKNPTIKSAVQNIFDFVQYFDAEKEKIEGMSKDDLLAMAKLTENVFTNLSESKASKISIFRDLLLKLIDMQLVIPKSLDDEDAFVALDALVLGTQTYVSAMYFVHDQYSYLANHYYKINDFGEYNAYFDEILNSNNNLKSLLVGSDPLLDMVEKVLNKVKQLDFVNNYVPIYSEIDRKLNIVEETKQQIKNFNLPIIYESPNYIVQFSFRKNIPTPMENWVSGRSVRYSIQYENNKLYSKLGDWSKPFQIRDKACPELIFPVEKTSNRRLVFRQFDDNIPELVGVIGPLETKFLDVQRDFFNAVGTEQQKGLEDAKLLLANGAGMTATFEKGRRALHAASEKGKNLTALQLMLKKYAEELRYEHPDIDLADNEGFSPLHLAARNDQAGFGSMLLSFGANINLKSKPRELTPLHLSSRYNNLRSVKMLLNYPDLDINARDYLGFSALHYAVLGGVDVVNMLISHPKCDLNPSSKTGLNPIHLAAIKNDVNIVHTFVLNNEVNVNAYDSNGMTPLHYAVMLDHRATVLFLLSRNVNVNAVETKYYWTPLHMAIVFKRYYIATLLINDRRVSLNALTQFDDSPLHYATIFGSRYFTETLLQRGVDKEKKTKDGYTPLHIASLLNSSEILALLLFHNVNVEADMWEKLKPLHLAAYSGQTENIEELLQYRANIKAVNIKGHLPVHYAVISKNTDAVGMFINMDPGLLEAKDAEGNSLIHVAASNADVNMVKYLVRRGANINSVNNYYRSALHIGSHLGNLEMVIYLMSQNADPYIYDTNNNNLLYFAVQGDRLNVVKHLLSHPNFDVKRIDGKRGPKMIIHYAQCDSIRFRAFDILRYFVEEVGVKSCNPLHRASWYGHLDLVKYVVENLKLNIDGPSYLSYTPLCRACSTGKAEVVKYLLEKGADIRRNCMKLTPLLLAIRGSSLDTVTVLAENGIDVRSPDVAGNTPLHHAVLSQNFEIVQYLVDKHKVDTNAANNNKETPLHLAAALDNIEIAKLLLENGADLNARNKYNKTPKDLSSYFNMTIALQPNAGRYYRTIDQNTAESTVYKLDRAHKFSPFGSLQNDNKPSIIGENYASNKNFTFNGGREMDVIGTLLLLDIVIRKLTHHKNKTVASRFEESSFNATANSLKLTEHFENFINTFNEGELKEKINMSEVYSRVYKTQIAGDNSNFRKVLCSYIEDFVNLNEAEMTHLWNNFANRNPAINNLKINGKEREVYKNISHLLTKSCLATPNVY